MHKINVSKNQSRYRQQKERREWAMLLGIVAGSYRGFGMNTRALPRLICDAGEPKCPRACRPGQTRCHWHGGSSTGPKTAEGKAIVKAAHHRGKRK